MIPAPPRRATTGDVDAIEALVDAAYRPWVPILGCPPLPMRADYAAAVRAHRIDLLHIGPKLAALIELATASDHLAIVNLAVAPAFQKRGLGRALLAHAEAVARDAGFSEVRLYTNVLMASNIALYRSVGFEAVHEEPNAAGMALHMAKLVATVTPIP